MTTLPQQFIENPYRFATNLVGFPSTTLRVKVLEFRDGYAWVVTADLLNAGCPLTLNAAQVREVAL